MLSQAALTHCVAHTYKMEITVTDEWQHKNNVYKVQVSGKLSSTQQENMNCVFVCQFLVCRNQL